MKLRVQRSLLLCLFLVASACGSSGGSTKSASAPKTDKPITIGVAYGASGWLVPFDTPSLAGLKIAVDDINTAGGINGRKLKVIESDTKSDLTQAVRSANQVIDQGADVLVVSCDFDAGSPAALVAQQKGIVTFSLCAVSPKFGVQGIGDMAYTVSIAAQAEGAVLATFAIQQGWKTAFALIDDSIAIGKDGCNGFRQSFTDQGGKVVGEATFKNSDASIASQVSQVRSSGAAVIADCSYVPGGVSAMRQLRAAGITAPILAGGSMDGAYWTKATPGLNDYYVATMASVFGDSPSSDVNRFTKRFTEVTGAAPLNQTAAIGYSVGQAIARAIERAKGSTDGTALRDVLNNFKDEQLLIGPTSFDAKTHIVVNRPMEILKYTNAVPAYMKNVKQATQVDLGLG